jgi:hypothetical protein
MSVTLSGRGSFLPITAGGEGGAFTFFSRGGGPGILAEDDVWLKGKRKRS